MNGGKSHAFYNEGLLLVLSNHIIYVVVGLVVSVCVHVYITMMIKLSVILGSY